jgi:hypothetical protein
MAANITAVRQDMTNMSARFLTSSTVMDCNLPAHVFNKKNIREECNPLLTNYVGRIGTKPVYDSNGPIESMDDILIHTKRGVREVTMEDWGKLKGYPATWDTTAKGQRRIIREPILHFWSVLEDALAPILEGEEKDWHSVDEDQ